MFQKIIAPASRPATRVAPAVFSSGRATQASLFSTASSVDTTVDAAASAAAQKPASKKLRHVPSVPFLGSTIPAISGVPANDLTKVYEKWRFQREKFGDFYTIGMPGLGRGAKGTVYVVTDPSEMLKVLHNEGTHPTGAIQYQWPTKRWLKDVRSHLGGGDAPGEDHGFWGDGPKWKRMRTFLQTDLLTPRIAKGYLPGMIRAAEYASKGAPAYAEPGRFHIFSSRASFDMFSSVMFGEFSRMANPGPETSERDRMFCDHALDAAEYLFPMMSNPRELFWSAVGVRTEMYDSFSNGWKNAREIAMEKSYAFMDRASEDRLEGDFQRRSYLANALRRQAEGDAVTREELAEMGFLILSASLDTTSALVNWLVLHLALSPSTQRTLRKELTAAMRDRGAETLVPEMYQQVRTLPYLHAVLRESHRCTPAIPINVIKKNKASALEIHGETIPQNSSILLDSYSVGWDPEFVPQPERFRPERWMDDAVEGRKGTLRQVLDHKMYQKPFSQGARQCPASRVANFEVLTMISQLVLDWDIALSEESEKSVRSFQDVPYYQGTTVQPVMPGFSFTARS